MPSYSKKTLFKNTIVLLLLLAAAITAALPAVTPSAKPKLVLAIAIDQFRYDYLTRYRSEYTGGLNRLLTRGAVFTDANYEHSPTVTAIGHSMFLSGAMPTVSGIIGNEWFERSTGKRGDQRVRRFGQAAGRIERGRRIAPAASGEHAWRRNEDRQRRKDARHRHFSQGSLGDSAGGPHGRRRVLGRSQDRPGGEQHLLFSRSCPRG